jgi:hypothetical protein
MVSNRCKATLRSGGTVLGTYVRHADAGLAEIPAEIFVATTEALELAVCVASAAG